MESRGYRWAGLALSLVWLLFCVFPLWWVFVTAFKAPLAVSQGSTYLPFIDFQPTLQAFRDALSGIRGDFLGPLVNSIWVSLTATFLSVLLGAMAAYALVRFHFKVYLVSGLAFVLITISMFTVFTTVFDLEVPLASLLVLILALVISIWLNRYALPGPVLSNDDVTFWFVSQRMFPPIVSAFALFLFYAETNKMGVQMLDSFFGLLLAYTAFGLPFAVWLMRDFFSSLPIEVEEAAQVDNIGRLRIFFQIVMPMSASGFAATSMVVLSFIWNEFLFALLLTSGKWQTLPILLAGQNSSRGYEWWAISVATLASIIPMIIVAILLGRMMRSGLFTGSMK